MVELINEQSYPVSKAAKTACAEADRGPDRDKGCAERLRGAYYRRKREGSLPREPPHLEVQRRNIRNRPAAKAELRRFRDQEATALKSQAAALGLSLDGIDIEHLVSDLRQEELILLDLTSSELGSHPDDIDSLPIDEAVELPAQNWARLKLVQKKLDIARLLANFQRTVRNSH